MTDAILPLGPLQGFSTETALGLSLLLGVAFGFFLERAGFGSAKNLTSIFILRDFRVFRVMFTAVITAMLGSRLLAAVGVLNLDLVAYDATFFWSMLAGGLLFGVGFYLGGYCPGTAAVAFARGRWDSVAFLLGISLGIYGFALLYDAVGTEPWFTSFYAPPDAVKQTIAGDGPTWPWVVGLTAVALVAFKIVPLVEKRFALKTVEQLEAIREKREPPPNEPPVISGLLVKVGTPLAAAAALAVAVLEVISPAPAALTRDVPRPAAVAVDSDDATLVAPRTLATWLVSEAHRRAEKAPPNAFFIDLRDETNRREHPLPGARNLDDGGGDSSARLARALEALDDVLTLANRNKPLVLISDDGGANTRALAAGLRRRGFNALVLDGGYAAFERRVLDADQPLLAFAFGRPAPPAPTPAPEATDAEATAPEADAEATAPEADAEATAPEADHGDEGHEADAEATAPEADAEATAPEADHGDEGHEAAAPTPPAVEPPPAVDLAALETRLRRWLAGRDETLPPRLAIPGSPLLPAKAATVQATGGGGGGCG